MKRNQHVLLIAHLFPPYFRVGARRPYYMARNLADLGFRVTVLTSDNPEETLSSWEPDVQGIDIIRVAVSKSPSHYSLVQKIFSRIYWATNSKRLVGRIARNISFFFLPMDHHLLPDLDTDIRIKELKPDIILASGGPWSVFETARLLKVQKSVPLYLDYRDPWNAYTSDLKIEVLQHMGVWPIGKLKEWQNKKRELAIGSLADGVISVSENTVKNSITASGCTNACLIYNGYGDEEIDQGINNNANEKLSITYTGTINKEQCSDILFKGIEIFLDQHSELTSKVEFNLIGVLSSRPEALIAVKKSPSLQLINCTEFITAEESRLFQMNSDVFISLGWRSLNGILGSKFFEYLKAGKPILLLSEKDDGKETLLLESQAGEIIRSPEELARKIVELIELKSIHGKVPYDPNTEMISKYSYRAQVAKLADFICSTSQYQQLGDQGPRESGQHETRP